MRHTSKTAASALLALGLACAHPAADAPQEAGASGGGAPEALQALAMRGVMDFYGVGFGRGLLVCVSLCEQGRCASPSPQFVARFEHEQYRVNEPGYCTWRDGRVTYSGRASAQLGAQQLSLRTPPRGALYLDLWPAEGCAQGTCTVPAKLTVGAGTTRGLSVLLEKQRADWRVRQVRELRLASQ
ncbi:hypothetical protein FGE12_12560 [Aggregicoccus sp. 17bor-14]|uniref:hypothetical protein n=1 Tax=Myxococcaceae TaxID=31 RepID=UPI00129CC5AE|nr:MULTISPECIES: hypothetical protein [Myxococcaceae]MBF5043223.1 hypothetical protein [Simulacricoccus sp. 17bor-14]MRI88980.1 hypothetical protein [Aggregicoccus sp. 17bor-14]